VTTPLGIFIFANSKTEISLKKHGINPSRVVENQMSTRDKNKTLFFTKDLYCEYNLSKKAFVDLVNDLVNDLDKSTKKFQL